MNAPTSPIFRGLSFLGSALVAAFLCVAPARAQGSSSIALRVSEGETGAPLPGATVRLDGASAGVSDLQGLLHIRSLMAGTHLLEVSMVGRRTVEPEVDLLPGRAFNLEVVLEPVEVPLPAMDVFARMRLPGEAAGEVGDWLADLDAARRAMAMALHTQAVTELSAPRTDPLIPQVVGRMLADPKANAVEGQPSGDVCVPDLFVDGVAVEYNGPVYVGDMAQVTSDPFSGPPEFGAITSECGVILIWTR